MGERRDRLSLEEREELTREATSRLLSLPELRSAKIVAGFVSTRSEINTEPALEALRERGVEIVLPRVSTELIPPRLRFHRVTDRSQLVFGIFGLLEPSIECEEVAAHAIDVFLVPGLAFDRHGVRIGYGGGYYDELAAYVRAHPDAASTLFAGFAFDFQLLDTCPTGEWDVPIDCVVTNERVVRCGENDD